MNPDFERDVYCVLGLPFDAFDMDDAVTRVRAAVQERRACFFSTPNLSFVTATQASAALRNSVLRSDMSIPDGMPLLWAARVMGVPMPERVAGSSLFNRLWQSRAPAIKVFFFGGNEGVAAAAAAKLSSGGAGLRCVGFDSPGFGSVQEMSSDERIERINASGAEFIVVSIGVAKGQAWIEHNRDRLRAPLIAYLGAVVNFVAGKVHRAPGWMQRAGLEWLWRIKEEPTLWRRYAADGITFAKLFVTRVIPYGWHVRRNVPSAAALSRASVRFVPEASAPRLVLRGAWAKQNLSALRLALEQARLHDGPLHLDLRDVTHLDSAVVALLCLLWAYCAQRGTSLSVDTGHRAKRVLRYCCADYLLDALSGST